MNAEKSPPAADASSQGSHWLNGRFFVPVPDMSDETSWVISRGRAWPAFMAIMRLLRYQERRGKTAEAKADAADGRLVVGVNALARAAGMTSTAILRQLRFLERQGFIKTHQERFVTETDPATGKITRNAAKAPPKVIVMTWQDSFQRPVNASKKAKRDTAEPNAIPTGGTSEPNAKGSQDRVRNEGVSIEANLQRGLHSMNANQRPSAAGPLERPAASTAKRDRWKAKPEPKWSSWSDPKTCPRGRQFVEDIAAAFGMTPAEVAATPRGKQRHDLIERYRAWRDGQKPRQTWEIEAQKHRVLRLAEGIGRILDMTPEAVIEIGKADKNDLRRRIVKAGYDPDTLRSLSTNQPMCMPIRSIHDRCKNSAYAIRRRTTAGVTLTPSDLRPAEDPGQRLQEAVEALPDASRDRADELGQEYVDEASADAQIVLEAIERKRAEMAGQERRPMAPQLAKPAATETVTYAS